MKNRCEWCLGSDIYERYHDEEWGVPVRDDIQLFENLTLEGAQAGLSWITILKKREGYRKAFFNWDLERIAHLTDQELDERCKNPEIVRHKQKIYSVRANAKAALEVQREFSSLSNYFWSFVNNDPIKNNPKTLNDLPSETTLSKTISKNLKLRGFTFVGSKTVYAFMQASGLVDDHVSHCWKSKDST